MRAGSMLLVLTAWFLVAAKDKDGVVWQEFSSRDGGFTVLMPGTPLEQKDSIRLPSGPTDLLVVVVERKRDETAFLVLYCELPEAVFKSGTDEKRLNYARNRAVASRKGKLVSEKKIKLGNYPGRELHFEVEGKGLVRQRLYAVKDKLYQLLVAGPREQALGKDADKFLQSFKLKP